MAVVSMGGGRRQASPIPLITALALPAHGPSGRQHRRVPAGVFAKDEASVLAGSAKGRQSGNYPWTIKRQQSTPSVYRRITE